MICHWNRQALVLMDLVAGERQLKFGSDVVSQWEVISEVTQYFAISSRNICVWQVPLFFGRGSDSSVDELPVHFHLSWS